MLSIKFNVDGFNMTFSDPDFMCGRIVGTIGPAASDEPHHLVMGRQFMTTDTPGNQGFFRPVHGINFCVARVDGKSIFLDLGNALPTGNAAPKLGTSMGSIDGIRPEAHAPLSREPDAFGNASPLSIAPYTIARASAFPPPG